MARFSQIMDSHAYWFFYALACLVFCLPTVAQQTVVSAPLGADDVMRRVVE